MGLSVNYPPPVCAVKGSTVTLPCTFTPLQSVDVDGRKVLIKIVRVRWCQKHLVCQGPTPSVYDSDSTSNDPRYKYLGDKKGNCTLQITDVRGEDDETFRFRMEADDNRGHWTEQSGVEVSVTGKIILLLITFIHILPSMFAMFLIISTNHRQVEPSVSKRSQRCPHVLVRKTSCVVLTYLVLIKTL